MDGGMVISFLDTVLCCFGDSSAVKFALESARMESSERGHEREPWRI